MHACSTVARPQTHLWELTALRTSLDGFDGRYRAGNGMEMGQEGAIGREGEGRGGTCIQTKWKVGAYDAVNNCL